MKLLLVSILLFLGSCTNTWEYSTGKIILNDGTEYSFSNVAIYDNSVNLQTTIKGFSFPYDRVKYRNITIEITTNKRNQWIKITRSNYNLDQ